MRVKRREFSQHAAEILHHLYCKIPLFQLVPQSVRNAAVVLHQKYPIVHRYASCFCDRFLRALHKV